MVRIGSQKYIRISFSLYILLITKFGYISLWMIATSGTSQNWGEKKITTADHDQLLRVPYVERRQILVQIRSNFFLFFNFLIPQR